MQSTRQILAFGPFRLSPDTRVLERGGVHVRLGSRAIELLVALAQAGGQIVAHKDLMAAAWPNTFVDDTNLRVHMSALRKALGAWQQPDAQYIVSVPGRGYRFGVPVDAIDAPDADAAPTATSRTIVGIPALPSLPVGRQRDVDEIVGLLGSKRCVSIVGPGGIGKTTVAVLVAEKFERSSQDGLCFVDLGPVTDGRSVPDALCAMLGVAVRSDDPVPNLVLALSDRKMVIVLDCCEHIIDAAADLAADILQGAPHVRILVTSREPLRIDGEQVYRLAPLGFPPESATPTVADAMLFPALELFVERAREGQPDFELDEAAVPVVADICRRLDGIALAIELAAGRLDAFGVTGLRAVLDDRFRLLGGGRRNAIPRHRTVQATIDWSFDQLPATEQAVLSRLSIFGGPFDLEAAAAVAADGAISSSEVIDAIANLVRKSLLAADISGSAPFYRLLDMTRASVLVHLKATGDFAVVARRHAAHYRKVFEDIERTWASKPKTRQLETYRRLTGNLRVALAWSFSAEGDPALARALAVASLALWMHLALFSEGIDWITAALRGLDAQPAAEADAMRLEWALGWLLMQARGPVDECRAAYERSVALSEKLGDFEFRLRSTAGLWILYFNLGQMTRNAELGVPLRAIAEKLGDRPAALHALIQASFADHMLGHQAAARQKLEQVLASYDDACQRVDDLRFIHDQVSSVSSFHARVLWLQGQPERAMAIVAADLLRDDTRVHPVTFVNALLHGLPIAAGCGETARLAEMAGTLGTLAQRFGLGASYGVWARAYRSIARLDEGDLEGGLEALGGELAEARRLSVRLYLAQLLAPYALGLLRAGRVPQARAAVAQALEVSAGCEEHWILPELLRIDGEVIRREGKTHAARAAEDRFRAAIDLAQEQAALWWELRATTSLADLLAEQGRAAEAADALAPILDRIIEGRRTPDLLRAQALLDRLRATRGT